MYWSYYRVCTCGKITTEERLKTSVSVCLSSHLHNYLIIFLLQPFDDLCHTDAKNFTRRKLLKLNLLTSGAMGVLIGKIHAVKRRLKSANFCYLWLSFYFLQVCVCNMLSPGLTKVAVQIFPNAITLICIHKFDSANTDR